MRPLTAFSQFPAGSARMLLVSSNHGICSNCRIISGRYISIYKPTKELDNVGKMLDIHARRDPQLAPYLLREVDIEFKRKNTKVKFVVWSMILTFLVCWNERLNCEELHFLKQYVGVLQLEDDEKALDADIRRAKLVAFLELVREAYTRDQKWTALDTKRAEEIFTKNASLTDKPR